MVKALTALGDCSQLEVLTVIAAAHLRTATVALEGVVEGVLVVEEEGDEEVEASQVLQVNRTQERRAHLALMLELCPIQVSMTEMVL